MKTNIITSVIKLSLLVIVMGMYGCIPDNGEELDLESPEVLESRNLDDANLRIDHAAQNQLVATVHKATAKYHRVEVAIADGYVPVSPCVVDVNNNTGAMGVHYLKVDLVDGVLEPTKPEALVYEPLPGGKYKLVAVEYIVVADLLEDRNVAPLFGQVKMDDHLHGYPLGFPHYQLHVWLWKNNPSGMYTPFNPKVTCMYFED
jgi:hypothetical protein